MMVPVYIFLAARFINHIFKRGSIFGDIEMIIESPKTHRILRQLAKPLFYCCVCMSPWYSLAYLLINKSFDLWIWVLLSAVVGGLNVVYQNVIKDE